METSNLNKIGLNIFSSQVEIESNSISLLERLKKDFSHFMSDSHSKCSAVYRFKAHLQEIPWDKIPSMAAKKQSQNCITYEIGGVRYNDYYGEALSIYSFKTQEAQIYSPDLERLHEITYLLGLSRTGKKMDMGGLHKIHAMGVSNKKFNFLVMMPMKGGKTTLLIKLLKRKDLNIISDDSPIIGRKGQIFSFPLRIGLESLRDHEEGEFDSRKIYQIHRKHYGTKNLIPINAFSNKISLTVPRKTILCLGIRSSGSECKIVRVPKIRMVRPLISNMVVGIGLPMILEYFMEIGIRDFIKNFFIIFSRFWSAMALLARAETYFLYMGKDIQKNIREIDSFLETH